MSCFTNRFQDRAKHILPLRILSLSRINPTNHLFSAAFIMILRTRMSKKCCLFVERKLSEIGGVSASCLNNSKRSPSMTPTYFSAGLRYFSKDNKNSSLESNDRKISGDLLSKDSLDTKIPLVGRFKNPIVAKLWAAREQALERMTTKTASELDQSETNSISKTEKPPTIGSKAPTDSATGIGYPFSTDPFLLETYKVSDDYTSAPTFIYI